MEFDTATDLGHDGRGVTHEFSDEDEDRWDAKVEQWCAMIVKKAATMQSNFKLKNMAAITIKISSTKQKTLYYIQHGLQFGRKHSLIAELQRR